MAWGDVADLATKACQSVFGQAVTYTPSGGSAQSITGIFEAAYEVVDLDAAVPVTGTQPMLDVRLDDLDTTPAIGDTFVTGGSTYEVTDVQLGGQGTAKLLAVQS